MLAAVSKQKHRLPVTLLNINDLDYLPKHFEDFVSKLGKSYPGHDDLAYMSWLKKVRSLPSSVSKTHLIPYSKSNQSTWSTLYKPLRELHNEYACEEHVKSLHDLERFGIFSKAEIPQFETINKYLLHKTGFRLVNVGGMINARTFLSGLGFGVFYSTQYIRHHSVPFYSPEPDIVHELMGHVPLLATKRFANFTRKLGKLAIGADDTLVDRLAKVYFFTVEFGVISGKILGAGILGSCKETERVGKGEGDVQDWNLKKVLSKDFQLSEYQESYTDVKSIESLESIFKEFISI